MSDHSTHFEASGGGLVLTNAILLYTNQAPRYLKPYGTSSVDTAAFASIHAVELGGDGRPTIAAGSPLTRAHLRRWSEALGRTAQPELLPEHVLVAHPDMLAWWVPGQVRPAHFALSDPPADLHALAGRTTLPVPYPPHFLIATRHGLGVYALPANERPSADTPVLHSPILNVFVDGRLCWGNIPKPRVLGIASIPAYESALFDSWSTHPNPGQDRTIRGKGGLVRLWDDLAARGATLFPVSRLKPFGAGTRAQGRSQRRPAVCAVTVGRLIARSRV
ncbi:MULTISPECIES: PRTRC system protein B [Sphingomonadaceae]|jgi:PRTRC genetic system protein B|uniref:PRTRC system protein B n=1 Tax=Sphingomonadales TaxID=204457 RepID=UPI000262C8B5|nr:MULTISPECIES: PRTRC system protein B [Sphingomonadaceae]QSR19489.1 PRTRC system protein B [Novosphingobium sp. KA1]